LIVAAQTRAAIDDKVPTTVINRDEFKTVKSNQSLQKKYFNGTMREDLPIEVHETELPPGEAPHPPHKHLHEEMALVQQGTLEVFIEGRETKRIAAGGLVYVASGQLHGWKNAGDTPARYFVVAIGRD
jgi:quercetin dioxygenase-like cupin family protein